MIRQFFLQNESRLHWAAWGLTALFHSLLLVFLIRFWLLPAAQEIPIQTLHVGFFTTDTPHINQKGPVTSPLGSPTPQALSPPKKILTAAESQKTIRTESTKNVSVTVPGETVGASVVSSISPVYPKAALNQEMTGTVIVRVYLDEQGMLLKTVLRESSGHEILDNAFIRAIVNMYRFSPAKNQGTLVEGTLDLSYTFSLNP